MNMSHKKSRIGLRNVLVCIGATMFFWSSYAQEAPDRLQNEEWPQASLNAQASAPISRDVVKITLAAELSDVSQAKAAGRLSKALDSVMKQAKGDDKVKSATIKVTSGNYQLWPLNDKEGKISSWHGRAEILLESRDFSAASDLAGALSDRMPVANLNFSVSPQARAKQEHELLADAVRAFSDRAQAVTDAFGFVRYTVRNVQVGGAGAQYQPAARAMSMSLQKSADIPLEGGTETVTVTVGGSIFLHSAQK